MPEQVRIVSNPTIMGGKPVVAGTRITVELILEKLAAGDSIPEILADYPPLTEVGIKAAIKFAAEALRSDFVYPIESAA